MGIHFNHKSRAGDRKMQKELKLKMKAEEHNVAQKLIAATADLEAVAADDMADVAFLKGWRREIFGNDALLLKSGKLGLSINNHSVKITYNS